MEFIETTPEELRAALAPTFGVITKVPDPATGGNLAASPEVYQETEGPSPSNDHYGRYEQMNILAILHLRFPVFTLGEILILDGPGGREVSGLGRKPSKWSVTCEEFDNIFPAMHRAREVRGW